MQLSKLEMHIVNSDLLLIELRKRLSQVFSEEEIDFILKWRNTLWYEMERWHSELKALDNKEDIYKPPCDGVLLPLSHNDI